MVVYIHWYKIKQLNNVKDKLLLEKFSFFFFFFCKLGFVDSPGPLSLPFILDDIAKPMSPKHYGKGLQSQQSLAFVANTCNDRFFKVAIKRLVTLTAPLTLTLCSDFKNY